MKRFKIIKRLTAIIAAAGMVLAGMPASTFADAEQIIDTVVVSEDNEAQDQNEDFCEADSQSEGGAVSDDRSEDIEEENTEVLPGSASEEMSPEEAGAEMILEDEEAPEEADEADEYDPDFQETGIFGAEVVDNNGSTVKAWFDDTTGKYYLFLTNACNIADIDVRITGVKIDKVSKGEFTKKTSSLNGAFSKSGDGIIITAADGSKYEVIVKQSGLPSLNITLNDTNLVIINGGSKDTKWSGQKVVLTDASGAVNLSQTGVELKGRGNTTWNLYDKKAYQIKFSKKQSVLGMEKAKKWILLANAFDDSMIRNQTAFYLAEGIGMTYVPHFENVDLWVDGEYRGSYIIGEKVEIGGSRLDLQSETGVLMEKDIGDYAEAPFWYYSANQKNYFALKEAVDEDTPGLAEEGFNRFKEKMTLFEDYIFNTPPASITINQLKKYIDVESAAKWYLVNEYTNNYETNATGTFWYLDGSEDVLHMGPVWDFDTSQGDTVNLPEPTVTHIKKANPVFRILMQSPEFAAYVGNIYTACSDIFGGLTGYASELSSKISSSADMNYIRWKQLGTANPKSNTAAYSATYGQAVSKLLSWLDQRYSVFGGLISASEAVPEITADYSSDRGEISVKVTNTNAYSAVKVAVWSADKGQDDLVWYDAAKDAGQSALLSVYPAWHKSTGKFYIDVYGITNGVKKYIGGKTVTVDSYPKAEAIAVKPVYSNSLKINLDKAFGYTSVKAAVWCSKNGQNDLKWYDMSKDGSGQYSAAADLTAHKETGTYYIDIYGEANNKKYYIDGTTVTVDEILKPKAAALTVTENQSEKVVLLNAADYTDVTFSVWGDPDGKNDIKTYTGLKNTEGQWYAIVDFISHGEVGKYNVEVSGKKGNTTSVIAKTEFTVTAIERPQITCRTSASGRVVKAYIENADRSFNTIKAAVWSDKNGQDDLTWVSGTKMSDGSWYIEEDLVSHKDKGLYHIHIYGYRNGKGVCLGGKTITAGAFEKPVITATEVKDAKSIALRLVNADDYAEVQFAVWTTVNGQDDLKWYNAGKYPNGIFRYNVNAREHGGNGTYLIDAYGVKNGKKTYITSLVYNVSMFEGPVITTYHEEGSNILKITVKEDVTYRQLRLYIWGDKNGQNDIESCVMTKDGVGEFSTTVDLGKHGETGKYHIHLYGAYYWSNIFAGSGDVNIDSIEPPKLSVTPNGSKVTLKVSNAAACNDMQFAVWTTVNGQDDLVWYKGTKDNNGSFICRFDAADHGGNGTYRIHCYTNNRKKFVVSDNSVKLKPYADPVISAKLNNVRKTIDIDVETDMSYSGLKIAVWGDANGQNDLKWYTVSQKGSDGKYHISPAMANHDGQGKYHIHVYGIRNGKSFLVGTCKDLLS